MAFDFYMVLLSFVVSMGVTVLLTSIAKLIQEFERVSLSWAHGMWLLVIFLLQVVFWLKSWGYHATFSLGLVTFICPLTLAILAFTSASLVAPSIPAEGPIDLQAFHRREGPKYVAAVALFYVAAAVQALIMGEVDNQGRPIPLEVSRLAVQGVLVLLALAALAWKRAWVQLPAAGIHLVLGGAYFVQLLS